MVVTTDAPTARAGSPHATPSPHHTDLDAQKSAVVHSALAQMEKGMTEGFAGEIADKWLKMADAEQLGKLTFEGYQEFFNALYPTEDNQQRVFDAIMLFENIDEDNNG